MAQGAARKNRAIHPGAESVLDKFKYEVASELNLPNHIFQTGYWGNLSAAQCGAVGGNMVKRMIEAAERSLTEGAASQTLAGFKAGLTQPGANVSGANVQPNSNV